ncbi:hypothetical protein J2I47_08515 [Fibrella sp. HMF5335]|uniref:Uncharacterized protein n=1 Tax=Fibrella rubiginis TaxID=2817060 RepID=A0A939GF04_9BACT|nr:hypothetical protein [Fibrella rubiginis]MBO0936583.1 hypothetical protein [Fibrella rubiginis]
MIKNMDFLHLTGDDFQAHLSAWQTVPMKKGTYSQPPLIVLTRVNGFSVADDGLTRIK